jgi:hypothetical protein
MVDLLQKIEIHLELVQLRRVVRRMLFSHARPQKRVPSWADAPEPLGASLTADAVHLPCDMLERASEVW